MAYETIVYEPGTIARVILNRPEKLNAQSWTMLEEMDDAFNRAAQDNDVRVIVLSGEGRAFSAGHDLDSEEALAVRRQRQTPLNSFGRSQQLKEIYTDSHLRWRDLPKPTIAMVHGYCVYGGWMIASAMDFIFAAEDALFIPTYGDYFTTSWDVGIRKAKEILFENTFMTANEAMTWGFVNRVYLPDELEKRTMKYADRVAAQDPFNTRTIKFQLNQTQDNMGFSTSVRSGAAYFIQRGTARPPEATTGAPSTPQQGRFRNLAAQAMEYLRQDREPES